MTEYVTCGKYQARVSTDSDMRPMFHHYVKMEYPIVVGPAHVVVGYFTLSKRSSRTGATTSNEISFLRIAKLKKDGTPSKIESWAEFNHSDDRLNRSGLQNFMELHALSPQYQKFHDMQVDLGIGLYDEYHDHLPDRHFNETAIQTYLDLKISGQLRREDAIAAARQKSLEVYTKFLGNDPIIGLRSLEPEPQSVSTEEISNQRFKINRLETAIINGHRYEIDWTDYRELRDEKDKLFRMEQGLPVTNGLPILY